ncbi:MAG: hypothetical protein AUH25_00355 [Thaumarchaeota archaeon 13_1_40CM_38_12]|nr:MAG: hypothetical protein AUH25_00355 [Thaumarchaeota archaeon 13_1_40CM_38_12]
MYNNILRKITSLSLLIILLTSTAAFVLPNAIPAAHAATNANLFVSAESSQFNNYFAGPQVVQVIVSDPDINRLDQKYGEPTVTVNGKKLRMAQNTDGNWYAYFADRNQAERASNTAPVPAKGLNFGGLCGTGTIGGVDFGAETKGFATAQDETGAVGLSTTATPVPVGALSNVCTAPASGTVQEHVVRENKTLNTAAAGYAANADLVAAWPVIQFYDFSSLPSKVTVQYQKAGGVQSVTLTFDRIPVELISTSADREKYSKNTQVFITMNDPQLNIDPTEEDSWTWGANTTNSTLYYQAFDRNGVVDADGTAGMSNLIPLLSSFMFNHNGKLTVNPATSTTRVIDFQSNGKQILTPGRGNPAQVRTQSISLNSEPITLIETGGVNTGTLGNWDGGKKSDIVTLDSNVIRDQSASFRYNDISHSIVGGFVFATLCCTNSTNTWASGQRTPIILTDPDANKNSKTTEHLDLEIPTVARLTTMKIGTPFSLNTGGGENATYIDTLGAFTQAYPSGNRTIAAVGTANTTINIAQDEGFSSRPIFNGTSQIVLDNTGALFVDLKTTMAKLKNTVHNANGGNAEKFKGFNFLNYDLRSLGSLTGTGGTGSITGVHTFLVYTTSGNPANLNVGSGFNTAAAFSLANSTSLQDFINLNVTSALVANGTAINNAFGNAFGKIPNTANIGLLFTFDITGGSVKPTTLGQPVVADFFSVGIKSDGLSTDQRINNGIYRWELEETGDNTSTFTGTSQYVMLNQLNIFDPNTYSTLRTVNHDVKFVAIQDMLRADARAPQATYLDLGYDGVDTQISAQQDITTHTGVVSFDSKTYKIADTVTITLNDLDLNVDNDLIDIYTNVPNTGGLLVTQDIAVDTIGKTGLGKYSDGTAVGRLLDIQFGQQNARWSNSIIPGDTHHTVACFATEGNANTAGGFATSLSATGFSLVETGPSTGIFQGTFEIPDQLCDNKQSALPISTVGQNVKVNYVDFRDDSSKLVEVSDNAGIRGNTGSVKFDKSVYPVPFGSVGAAGTTDFDTTGPATTFLNGVFPLHRDVTESNTGGGLQPGNVVQTGDVVVHIRVNDRDFDTSAVGTDKIATAGFDGTHGPVAVQIARQGNSMLLATAGFGTSGTGTILRLGSTTLPAQNNAVWAGARELGPMIEIAPDAGIFQADLPIKLTDGPEGGDCPAVNNWQATNGSSGFFGSQLFRFNVVAPTGNYCVRQGDVMTVTYLDLNDASGHQQTVTDSSTFDLRNGVLQSDKSVYIIGSDMILTLVEPDLNRDSQTAEAASLDLIEWDSHAFKGTMGPNLNNPTVSELAAFDPKPSTLVETGKDTGIFQAVIKIPKKLGSTLLERGEQIHLEYTDWGPAGSKTVGKNDQDIHLTIYTSNFGATVELDQKVYTWTDRVYTTVVAPDHNFDPNLIDTIGDNRDNQVTISTRGNSINNYKLVETGVDTGIFTGYVILTGDENLKAPGGVDGSGTEPTGVPGVTSGNGPTDGFIPAEDSDGVSVSFEFTKDQTVTGSALIRWNIGEIKWLEASYPANGQGVLQIVDPDMNLNPKAVDKFDTSVWSDSDSGGIKLTMTETGEATGIFQGTAYFTTNFQSSGNRLHVAEGDTVTGEYKDRTLPAPYTPADQLRLTSTTFIGTIVPPLERAPAANPRIVDSFGNAITGTVKSGQQIQITADLTNGQDRDQPFAYLVQVQDSNGVTVSLSWITGTLTAGQSLNPAQSWTPTATGTYTAQIFVWQSIDNPNALSPPLSTTINVA